MGHGLWVWVWVSGPRKIPGRDCAKLPRMLPGSALRFWRSAATAAIMGLAACGAARAEGFRTPTPASRLEPGAAARVQWEPRGNASRFDEMELVLSLDGGSTFPIRVTRALAAGTTEWTWRVPSLPTAHARLALRAGEEERPEAEEVVFVSEEFEIVAQGGAPLEHIFSIDGEWRTADALEGRPGQTFPATLGPSPAASSLEIPDAAAPLPPPRSLSIESPSRDSVSPPAGAAPARSLSPLLPPRPLDPLSSLRL